MTNQKIKQIIKKNFKEQVLFLQKLVQTKSANPFTPENSDPNEPIEREVAHLIKGKLREIGLKPKLIGVSKQRPNVVAELKGKGKKTLILNGHMDTILPPEDYSFNPWSGKIEKEVAHYYDAMEHHSDHFIFY